MTLTYNSIADVDTGVALDVDGTVVEAFLRGDAKADGVVGTADILFISQYLAGLRTAGQGLDKCHPINAASVRHDGTAGDAITVSDCLFIRQYLAGIRDASFNVV